MSDKEIIFDLTLGITEDWSTEDTFYCPCCKKKEMWRSENGKGNEYLCIDCDSYFHITVLNISDLSDKDIKRLEKLKE